MSLGSNTKNYRTQQPESDPLACGFIPTGDSSVEGALGTMFSCTTIDCDVCSVPHGESRLPSGDCQRESGSIMGSTSCSWKQLYSASSEVLV